MNTSGTALDNTDIIQLTDSRFASGLVLCASVFSACALTEPLREVFLSAAEVSPPPLPLPLPPPLGPATRPLLLPWPCCTTLETAASLLSTILSELSFASSSCQDKEKENETEDIVVTNTWMCAQWIMHCNINLKNAEHFVVSFCPIYCLPGK